ncbi:hypothetical protein B5M42_004440 [Paenibacillus athensensis]|uniref:Uncharacterized protein n=1 Tax=Paenibacillus athensensis TaxID=1967502 RepID=A0A4Y8PQV5_9BACL|nr:hypothetical protein [Paenibacillus athensensis]MCD1258087.1 hypothetical protein [Paenibacillus athensensis]
MAALLDYAFNEAAIGTNSLPFPLLPGVEVGLATINLTTYAADNTLQFQGTVGWQPDLALLTPLLPVVTFRIRVGGSAPSFPLLFETSDSAFLGTGILLPLLSNPVTTSFTHAEKATAVRPDAYFLTAELVGLGAASIVGPVHLSGSVIG